MKRFSGEISGAIYDVDDTLLNNQPDGNDHLSNLHQRARLKAFRAMGERYPILHEITPQENYDSFAQSPVHTVAGAFWVALNRRGILGDVFDPLDPLILELIAMKNEAYADLLLTHGQAHDGAIEFIRSMNDHYDLHGHNAIASTAIKNDVRTFLQMTDLTDVIPEDHIITIEDVTHPKPHPEAFDKAFRTLNLADAERAHVLAFEDDPRGMLSARKAGLVVCAITTRYDRVFLEHVDAQPDFIADNFAEFHEIFNLPPLPE